MKPPKTIGEFTLYTKKPNTLAKGFYYQKEIFFDVPNDFKKRMIRVYLPSDYDFENPEKKFPVIYMTDGQNLCDDYLSGYGEWHVDETIENRIKNHQKSFIAVGVDCPYDDEQRMVEMTIPCNGKYIVDELDNTEFKKYKKGTGFAENLANLMLKVVKPIIDNTFYTLKNKKNTAVGGSSMGGLMAFYMGMKYKNLVGFSLCFSPAFLVYENKYFLRKLNAVKFDPKKFGKFILYTGGKDFESEFIELTFGAFKILREKGFDDTKLRLIFDSNNIHHEKAWGNYFPHAISYWLDKE